MTLSPQFITSAITIFIIINTMLLAVSYLIMLERKAASWVQDRIGPNRTGFSFGQDNLLEKVGLGKVARFHFWGLGQPLADGLKMLIKEDYTPPFVEKALFLIAPGLVIIPALIAWAVIPWGGVLEIGGSTVSVSALPVHVGVIYILAVGSMAVYGVVVGGYGSANKYAFLGSLRATAQMLSYEIPQALCVLIVILMVGSAASDVIAIEQAQGLWTIAWQPLLAVIFFLSVLAECNRAPFDLAECEQELVAGYHTEYSSMKFALYFLGEYMHMITGAAFFALLFLGAWDIPFITEPTVAEGIGWVLIKFGVFAGKVFLLLFLMILIRWTIPRFRFDQLMRLAWTLLVPVALSLLLVTTLVIFMDLPWWWLTVANAGAFVGFVVVYPLLPRNAAHNQRVPLRGSRFSAPNA